jgi:hypothetical protein
MLDWLFAPMSGSSTHTIAPALAWHARLMVLAWGVMLPLGALTARYFKLTPGHHSRYDGPRQLDPKGWWHTHRLLQYGGIALMSLGVMWVWGQGGGAAVGAVAWWHMLAGWAVFALGWLQVLGGWLRGSKGGPGQTSLRGDHYDMTLRRRVFERLHKSLGWLAVGLSVAAIALGLVAADAPRWMACALLVWWLLLAAAAWRLQMQGRCIDTYQVIWGPDPVHPGNRVAPIGWGIRRPPN